MHIGMAGPIDLAPLHGRLPAGVPDIYTGPCTGWLARTWLEQGHQMTLYALSECVLERRVYSRDSLRLVVVPQRPTARERARDFFRHERLALAAAMQDYPTELVNAHWTYEFALAAVASGRPAFVTAHDTPLRVAWEMRSVYRWARHMLAFPVLHRAHAISANSPYTASHLKRSIGVRQQIKVIPNGIRADHLPNAVLPSGPPVFASAAQGWSRLKNTATLLKAFAVVRHRIPGARLLLFGSGHGPNGPAFQWATSQFLVLGVEFVGQLPHQEMLQRLAAESHILVHPSRVESFSMITAEAMGMGLPVIVGAHSGAVSWVAGDGGLTTDINSPSELADAMDRLATDRAMQLRASEAGRARVIGHFELREVASRYISWFETELDQILQKKGKHS